MSWRGADFQLATPECLRQFIKELIDTELISEQQRFQICSTDIESTTKVESDPAYEMDLRHIEAREINEARLAQMKIPKQELIKEARRIVSQEEKQQRHIKHQNAAYNRELRNIRDELKKSNCNKLTHYRPTRSSSANIRIPRIHSLANNAELCRARRAKSTGEIELEIEELKSFDYDEQLSSVSPTNDTTSSTGSDDSAVTVLSRIESEGAMKESEFSLPPLNITVKTKANAGKKSPKASSPKLEPILTNNTDREQLRKYWLIWRAVAFRKRNLQKLNKSSEEKMSKIDKFLSQFEISDDSFTAGSNSSSTSDKNRLSSLSANSKRTKSCSNLEQIIKEQKSKLREQEKLINKLKLEQIKLAADKSMQSTQEHVEKSIQESSLPIKRKLNYLRSSFPNILDKNYYEKPRPSFLVQMEKRQKERLERKVELRERTRLRIIEQKRLQKEKEEAKKAEIAEKKRLDHELKLEQLQIEAEMRANEQAAAAFCRLRRMRLAFGFFRHLLEERRKRLIEAEVNRERKLAEAAFKQWRMGTRVKVKEKIAEARKHYQDNLLRFAWNQWRAMALDAKRDRQVAEDYYDLMASERAFRNWRAATKTAYEEFQDKAEEADIHYNRFILKKCWGAWKKLHHVLAEEKQVEMKKESLRNAIRVILPDFRPNFIECVKTNNNISNNQL